MDNFTVKNIQVSVQAKYEPASSFPSNEKYVFSYHVQIINNSFSPVQLIDRHWEIIDADNVRREVRGPGVIGIQPIIKPGEFHAYDSWSVLRTSLGKMMGSYGMINSETKESFRIEIPPFQLVADFVFN